MINVVSWNIGKYKEPWRELVRMAGDGDADVALVQTWSTTTTTCSGTGTCTTAGR